MKIALTQMDISWEAKEENKRTCRRLIAAAKEKGAVLIAFPEMTLTGFTMRPELFAEPEKNSNTENFFLKLSAEYKIAILFGRIEKRQDGYYNLLEIVEQDRIILKYRKIHPFSYGGESVHYKSGSEIVTTIFHGAPIGAFICYDLRFPEIFQISSERSEVIFVIANWPQDRIGQWDILLNARAVENQAYVLGINRTGGLHYCASSVAYDPFGHRIAGGSEEEIVIAEITPGLAASYRKDFPVKQDRQRDLYERFLKER